MSNGVVRELLLFCKYMQ